MNKKLLSSWLLTLMVMLGSLSAWAYTPALTADYQAAGYKFKAFYNVANENVNSMLPESGDLRYRGGGFGLFNFGSGNRGADITLSVAEGDLLIAEFKDTQNRGVTINSISNATKNDNLSSGDFLAFDITADATTLNINVGRGGCILAFLVMEKDASVATATYTIDYLLNGAGAPVKTETGEGAVGSSVQTLASFFNDGSTTKYFRAADAPESVTIAAEGNNFDINVRLAETYSYTLTSSLGGTIATGSGFEGETARAGYPRYALSDNVFYEAGKTNNEYRKTLTLTANNTTQAVTYNAKEGVNAVFFAEGENIEGMTATESGNIPVRASNALAATSAEDVAITTLPAGKYIFHVGIFTSKSSYGENVVNFGIGSETFAASFTNVNLCEVASEEYELTKSTPITFQGTTSWADAQLDYIWIEKTGDVEAAEPTIIDWVAADQGYTNAQDITTVQLDDKTTATFSKGTGSSAPKYYDNGNNVRVYSKNTITFAGEGITKIELTHSNGYAQNLTASTGTYTVDGVVGTWTGNANEIVLTNSASGQDRITKIRLVYGGEAGDVVKTAKPTITPNGGTFYGPVEVTLGHEDEEASIFYTLNSEDWNLAVEAEPGTKLTITENTVLRAKAFDYENEWSDVVEATFTFPEVTTVDNIAAFKALDNNTVARLKLTNAVVTYVAEKDDRYRYVEDATGAIVFFKTGIEMTAGQKINGEIVAKYSVYNSLPELTAVEYNGLTFTAGEAPVPTTITVADMLKAESLSKLVKTDVVDIQDGKLVQGANEIAIYTGILKITLPEDLTKANSVTGIVSTYNGYQFLPISYEEYAEVAMETGSETSETATGGGSSNAQVNGQSYFVAGTYIAGTGSAKTGNMAGKGFKLRTGADGNRAVFTINEPYTVTSLVLTGASNYELNDGGTKEVSVVKVEADGQEVPFTGGEGFKHRGQGESCTLTITGISATESIAIYFDNGDSKGSQINATWVINYERPVAAQPTIAIAQEGVKLVPGATFKLNSTVDPAVYAEAVTWSSDNEAVATVAADGTVTAVAAGVANISLAWNEDATVADVAVVTVTDFDPANYNVAKAYDFTTMGDVTLTLASEVAGAIWNEANSKVNNVYFCTNEGLEQIAVQAAAASNGKGWSIVDGQGLFLGSGAGRCAAVKAEAGQVVELFYTGSAFYTGSKNDAVRKDDGAAKTAYNEGLGRAIYKMDEDGLLGFELVKGNAITKINVYEEKPATVLFAGEDGKYYLKNVASGKFLGAANDWGTRASLVDHAEYVTLARLEDGNYTLESQVSNGNTNYYFGGDYMDGQPIELTITQVAEGQYTIANGDNYFGYDGTTVLGKNLAANSDAALWQVLTEAEQKATLDAATVEEPADATFLILDPNFGRNNRNVGAWTMQASNQNLSGGDVKNMCAESWHSAFTLSQTLNDVPNGVYSLTAQGFYRQDGSDNDNLPEFYLNDETAQFPFKTGSENNMSDASTSFTNGLYKIDPIFAQVENGVITLGARNENLTIWAIWDNFELTYYGNSASVDEVKNAAIIQQLAELREKAAQQQDQVEVEAVKTALADALTATANVEPTTDALNAAIATLTAATDKAEASIIAKNVLPKMKDLIDRTNVYTQAALDEYYTQWAAKYEDGSLTKIEAAALQDPTVFTQWHAAITVDNFLLSAWDTNPDFVDAPYYINSWSVEGESDGSEFKVPFFEYWTGDGDSLGERTLTATMNDLEAGEYDVTAWVRVRIKNGAEAPAYGINLQTNTGTGVDVTGEQVGTTQFYLKEVTARGTVGADGVLNIKFNIAADNNISWLSFKNVKFVNKTIEAAKAALAELVAEAQAIDTEGKAASIVAELNAAIAAAQAVIADPEATGAQIAEAQATLAGVMARIDLVVVPEGVEIAQWYYEGTSYQLGDETKTVGVAFDGNDIYVQGLNIFLPEAWVKGTVNGQTATFAPGQFFGSYLDTYDMFFGAYSNTGLQVPATFTYDAQAGVLHSEDILLVASTATATNFYDYLTAVVITRELPVYEEVETPAELAATAVRDYIFSASEVVEDEDNSRSLARRKAQYQGYTNVPTELPIKVAVDGNDAYIQGLVDYLPENWVKGTIDATGKITIPSGEYVGELQGYKFFFTAWQPTTGKLEDAVLQLNQETGELSMVSTDLLVNSTRYVPYYWTWYTDVNVIQPELAVPVQPEIIDYIETANGPYITNNIPLEGTFGEKLYAPFTSYRIYSNINGLQEPFVFTADDYFYVGQDLGDVKEIPYNYFDQTAEYENGFDIQQGGSVVFLNASNIDQWRKIGLQTVYNLNGKTRSSEIFWFTIGEDGVSVGIDGINANNADAIYYDVQGRRVDATTKGLLIKQVRQADGTVKTIKVVRK